MGENICYKFGIPHSADLQKLQEMCVNITSTNIQFQKFLLFILITFGFFLILVFFTKFITANKTFITAYYKSSFTYFIQLFTVITILPILVYLFSGYFDIISKLVVTFGALGIIFIMYEYWPIYKKDVEINNSIVSTVFLTIFTLTFYHAYSGGIKSDSFINASLISIFMIYMMILNIFIKLAIDLKRKSDD